MFEHFKLEKESIIDNNNMPVGFKKQLVNQLYINRPIKKVYKLRICLNGGEESDKK